MTSQGKSLGSLRVQPELPRRVPYRHEVEKVLSYEIQNMMLMRDV